MARIYDIHTHTDRRWYLRLGAVILPFVVLSVAAVLTFVYAWTRPVLPEPAASLAPAGRLNEVQACPRDTLVAHTWVTVTRVPAYIEVVESVWSVRDSRTVVFDMTAKRAGYFQTGRFLRTFLYTIPRLPPGRYTLNIVAVESGALPSGFAAPFRIREDCM